MSTPTPILVLYVDNINGIPILVLDVDSYINGISQLLLLLVLPTAENSPNEVRARERESADPGDLFVFLYLYLYLYLCFCFCILYVCFNKVSGMRENYGFINSSDVMNVPKNTQ